jgi:hypothetical protein
MILEIFALLVAIAFVLVYFGYYSDLRVYSIVGFVFLFILSAWVLLSSFMSIQFATSGLQYYSGSNITVVGSSTIVSDMYSTYNDTTTFWVGFILSLISGFSVWLIMVHDKR